jgi:hypothetical protein
MHDGLSIYDELVHMYACLALQLCNAYGQLRGAGTQLYFDGFYYTGIWHMIYLNPRGVVALAIQASLLVGLMMLPL